MKNTSPGCPGTPERAARIRRALRACAAVCLCAALLAGCSGGDENVITVYNFTASPVDVDRRAPEIATAEPTAIPAAEATQTVGDDVAWELSGGTQPPLPTQQPTEAPVLPADLRIGYVARDSDAIAPYECVERDVISLNQLMYESVVELNSEYRPVPLLADRWTVERTDSETAWTFELRTGVRFHNGATLTAQDVLDSFTAFAAAGEGNPYYAQTKLISRMEVVTSNVLRVYARNPGWITLYAMTFPVMQSSSIYTPTPRGTGPYWLISYAPGSRIRLEANPLWWKRPGNVRSIETINYANTASLLMALNSGDVDMVASRSYAASESRNLSDMISLDFSTGVYELLTPNLTGASLLANLQVRRAIMYAIDRERLQNNGYLSMLQSSETPVMPGSWLYETQSAVFYYSPERALQLLYDDGWGDSNGDGILDRVRDGLRQELTLTLITYSEDSVNARVNAAQVIAEDLERIGMRVQVQRMGRSDVLRAMRNSEFDLALIGVNLNAIAPNPGVLVSSEGELNFSGYRNTEMDQLCDAMLRADGEDALRDVLSDIQMRIVNDLPILGLGFHTGAVLSRASLNGLSGLWEYDVWNGLELMELQ